ncbi:MULTISPECIES: hypothetical protein [Rhodococcus]|uniref:hypothetical protein n=1 Tax=Rhodococcus TaxID=1827 RepID=UPI001E5CB687|nr:MULTISPECIES: hypothetical protein [Rhodococcus]BDB58945.1 hypothetical protein RDE2_07390 [Rhodococcus sp. RDE2]
MTWTRIDDEKPSPQTSSSDIASGDAAQSDPTNNAEDPESVLGDLMAEAFTESLAGAEWTRLAGAEEMKPSLHAGEARTSVVDLVLAGHWFEVRLNQWPDIGELRITDCFGNYSSKYLPSLGYDNGGQGMQPGPLSARLSQQMKTFRTGPRWSGEHLAGIPRLTVHAAPASTAQDGILGSVVVDQPQHDPVERPTDRTAPHRLDDVSSNDGVEDSNGSHNVPVTPDVRFGLARDENMLELERRWHNRLSFGRFSHDASPSAEGCGDHSVGDREVTETTPPVSVTSALRATITVACAAAAVAVGVAAGLLIQEMS